MRARSISLSLGTVLLPLVGFALEGACSSSSGSGSTVDGGFGSGFGSDAGSGSGSGSKQGSGSGTHKGTGSQSGSGSGPSGSGSGSGTHNGSGSGQTSGSGSGADGGENGLVVLASTHNLLTGAIAVNTTSVYWSTAAGNEPGSVLEMPTTGGMVVTIYTGDTAPSVLALDSTSVYWCDESVAQDVVSAPLAGGTATTLFSGQPVYDLAIGPSAAYFWSGSGALSLLSVPLPSGSGTAIAMSASSGPMATSGGSLYWADQTGDIVGLAPVDGGAPTTLTAGSASLYVEANLAVSGTNVYWVENDIDTGSDALLSVPVGASGAQPTTLATGAGFAGIAVDSMNVYYTTNSVADTGAVMQVALSGGTPTTVYAGASGLGGIAVDATSVYWTNTAVGTVNRFTPK